MSNKDHDYKGVYFTLGPIYFHQFNSFIKHGVGAMKLFQYIKTKQDLTKKSWVKVDNKNSYKWFGLSSSTKWRAIKKLEQDKLIEEKKNGLVPGKNNLSKEEINWVRPKRPPVVDR